MNNNKYLYYFLNLNNTIIKLIEFDLIPTDFLPLIERFDSINDWDTILLLINSFPCVTFNIISKEKISSKSLGNLIINLKKNKENNRLKKCKSIW